jgi:hypothetical protein
VESRLTLLAFNRGQHLAPGSWLLKFMKDYVYPSVFFAYFFFFLALVVALFFFFRTCKDGYWGQEAEEAKYRMLADEDEPDGQTGRA